MLKINFPEKTTFSRNFRKKKGEELAMVMGIDL